MDQARFDFSNWNDITPIKQCDGTPPILGIKYPADYEKLMDIFRAIVQSGEVSHRVFSLTEEVIDYLPSNYNAWYVRRKCLFQLGMDLQKELDYLNVIGPKNEKVYQIWFRFTQNFREHRRQIVEKLGTAQGEIENLQQIFDQDNKNYHAWGYRIWLCQTFNLYDQEDQNIDYYLEEDIGNNSAWNYRYFLKSKKIDQGQIFQEELSYIFKQINVKQTNEAAWNYLKGWFRGYELKCLQSSKQKANSFVQFDYKDYPQVSEFVFAIKNRFSYAVQIDILLLSEIPEQTRAALTIIEELQKIDSIRKKYWLWFAQKIIEENPEQQQ